MTKKLVDMKTDGDQAMKSPGPLEQRGPQYPYGLALRLETDQLKKLGIEKLPEMGAKFMLVAASKVTSVSESRGLYGEHRCVELQVTAMQVGEAGTEIEES